MFLHTLRRLYTSLQDHDKFQSLLVVFICSPDHKRSYNIKTPTKVQGHTCISAYEKALNRLIFHAWKSMSIHDCESPLYTEFQLK